MLIFGKKLIVFVDAQELRRVAFTNLFASLLNGKNVLLLDCNSVEAINSDQIFPATMQNTAPLFILNAGALRLADPQIAHDIAALRLIMPQSFVLVMVDADWSGEIDVAAKLAINGVVSMSMPPRDVVDAIEIALMGGTYFPKVSSLGKSIREPIISIPGDAVAHEQAAPSPSREIAAENSILPFAQDKPLADIQPNANGSDQMNLSRRQIEVLKTLQSGLSNKEIARSLGLSEATIKIHVSHLMRKFGVVNRTQVAVLSRQSGIHGSSPKPGVRYVPSL